jgi:hypothetical protein
MNLLVTTAWDSSLRRLLLLLFTEFVLMFSLAEPVGNFVVAAAVVGPLLQ